MNQANIFRKGYADSRMGQVHFVEAGRGPTLVLIPHAGRSVRMFRDLIAALSGQYHVVAFDVPGTGESVCPPPGDITVSDLADCLIDAIDFLHIDRFSLFGLHGGNKIGASIVVRHPGRVAGFLYVGQSHSIVVSKEKRAQVFAATPCINSVVSTAQALSASQVMWAREFRDLTDIWWDDTATASPPASRQNHQVERALDSLQSFQWRPFFYRATAAYDMEADLRRIDVPTLILELATPAEDREVGRQGAELLRTIPNSRLVTMEFPDTFVVTLEDSVHEVADLVKGFLKEIGV